MHQRPQSVITARPDSLDAVYVIDPFAGGHHPVYMRYICRAFLSLGCRVVAICPQAKELHKQFADYPSEVLDRLRTFDFSRPSPTRFIPSLLNRPASALMYWRKTAQQIFEHSKLLGWRPSHVFFAWLDEAYVSPLLPPLLVDKYFHYPWSGIYFLPYHLRSKQRLLPFRKGILSSDYIFRSRECNSVCVTDEGIQAVLAARTKKPKIIVLPDIADDVQPDVEYPPIREIRTRAGTRKIVGLLGGLSRRKGMIPLLQAAKRLRDDNLFFVFAGRLINATYNRHELETLNDLIANATDNCYFALTDIPGEAQFNALVTSCDLLSVIYEDFFHSSNILTKAAIFSKPVIGAKDHLIGERITEYGIGATVTFGNVEDYITKLRDFASGQGVFAAEMTSNYLKYRSKHSEVAFREAIRESIFS